MHRLFKSISIIVLVFLISMPVLADEPEEDVHEELVEDSLPGIMAPKEGTWLHVDGYENWRYEYDISAFKPGMYNILVRAADSAGNISFAGPFNIVIDPKSDLPVTRIANPIPGMRVGGDLNVVGTCVDDDNVGEVQVRIDDGEWVKAEGTNYWSYYLETAELEDGRHTLYARGVDEFGVTGEAVSAFFHLDRTKPLHTILQPEFGTLVSGRLTMSGTIYDANGLKTVTYSLNDGETWLPLKYSLDKKTGAAAFTLNLDTKKMDDGPAVVWFRSVDGVGSEGVAVFLYFVDNTGPELSILSPARDEVVNGEFTVSGRVRDAVGVSSLRWIYGKESGEIELVPGNPYFTVRFMAPPSGKATVVFKAEDVTGNIVTVNVERLVEPRSDLAGLELSLPVPGSTVHDILRVNGGARDDDGIIAVEWRIDNGETSRILTDGSFAFTVSDIPSGSRQLHLRAIDKNDKPGLWTTVPFVFAGTAPILSLGTAIDKDGERPFRQGMTLSTMDGKAQVQGTLRLANPISSLAYSISGWAGDASLKSLPLPKGSGEFKFTIPLPASLPYGVLFINIHARDIYGKEGVYKAPVYSVNYSRPRVGPIIDFADAGAESDGHIVIAGGSPLLGAFITSYEGEGIKSVSLEPASSLVEADFSGKTIRLEYRAQGITEPTMVKVLTERGHVFEAGPYVFRTDIIAPDLRIAEPAFGQWFRDSAQIKVDASDEGGLAAVEYSLDGRDWLSLGPLGAAPTAASGSPGAAPTATSLAQSGNLELSGLSGPVYLELRARDNAGNISYASTAIMVDNDAPRPERLLPRAGDPADGRSLFAVKPGEEPWSIASIELGRDGRFESLDYADTLVFYEDTGIASLVLRVTDRAGNIGEIDLLEGLDRESKKTPPAELSSLKTNVDSSGGLYTEFRGNDAVGIIAYNSIISDNTELSAFPESSNRPVRISGPLTVTASFFGINPDAKKPEAYWGVAPDSTTIALPLKLNKITGAWELSLKLPQQSDGINSLWFMIPDTYAGPLYTRLLMDCDSTLPIVEIIAPAGATSGNFSLVARASDKTGIRKISWEYGAEKGEFDLEPGNTDVSREFSLAAKAGTLLVVKAIDGSGNQGVASFVPVHDLARDTPQARIIGPLDGTSRDHDRPIFVYAHDDDGIASLSLAVGTITTGAAGAGPLFAIDPGSLPAGKYNLSLVAADITGRPSAKVTASFTRLGAAPGIEFQSFLAGKDNPLPLGTGSLLVIGTGSSIQGRLIVPNGMANAEYSINDGPWTKLAVASKADADGYSSFTLPLASTLPFERILVRARVIDSLGVEAICQEAYYRVAALPSIPINDEEAVYISDARIQEDGSILLRPDEGIGLLFNGRPLESVSLLPELPYMKAAFDGSIIELTAIDEGIAEAARIVAVTVDGDIFRSEPIRFIADREAPEIRIEKPDEKVWVKTGIELEAIIEDENGIALAQWSVDGGGEWSDFSIDSGQTVLEITEVLPLEIDDGYGILLLKAVDMAGRESLATLPFWKDSRVPEARIVAPASEDLVNGFIYIGLEIEDEGDLARAEFSADGENWEDITFSVRGAAPKWPSGKEGAAPEYLGRWFSGHLVDLGAIGESLELMGFRFTDKAGNSGIIRPLDAESPAFAVDIESDKPVVQIQVPYDNEVMRADFVVSGMAFDDDGVKEIVYRVDEGEWLSLEGANSFSVPFKLLETADNEHLFEAYAIDLNGVKGEIVQHRFRVSQEEPVGKLLAPDVSITNKGVVELKGEASDKNGISEVWVSFDNGNTYNKARGTTDWEYTLDTRILEDGVHSVYLKLIDGYDTPGFAAGLISIDNTPPHLEITGPNDGDEFIKQLTVGGRVSDAVIVESLSLELTQIGGSMPAIILPVTVASVYSKIVDISELEPGWYNIKVIATDRADNMSYQARNIWVRAEEKADVAEFVFPAHGEKLSGNFTLDGRIVSSSIPQSAEIFLGDSHYATVSLNKEGYFSLPVGPQDVEDGSLLWRIEALGISGARIVSEERSIEYSQLGPWVDISSFSTGDFVSGRPYLTGSAGWNMQTAERTDKEAWAQYQKLLKERKPVLVEISRDNGRSFDAAKGVENFKYRLESQEYANGELRLLIRVTFANGETATRKRIFTVDTKAPEIAIVQPSENGRYNNEIVIEGTAWDLNGLSTVELVLRKGDKASYEVPGFIQGSYLDVHILGATRFEVGLGLSFFEDNVKLQAGIGQGFEAEPKWDNLFGLSTDSTPESEKSRFGGWVLGLKMLANVGYLPFGYYFGPDWDFFSMSFTIGAAFTYFSQSYEIANIFTPDDDKYMVLSEVLAQWEMAKVSFNTSFFKSIALYLEGGIVFIPSEVSASLAESMKPNVAIGLRIGLF